MKSNIEEIRTLEIWSVGIVRSFMKVLPEPYTLFVPFIIASNFAVLTVHRHNRRFAADPVPERGNAATDDVTETMHNDSRALSAKIIYLRDEIHDLRSTFEYDRVYRRNWLKSGERFARNASGPSRASSVS